MKPTLCSRCKKNVAVVFITRLDPNGQNSHNEGLCLKCARELNIRPVTDMIEKMGLSDEELEGLTNEMMSAFDGTESMQDLIGNITESLRDVAGERDDDEDEEGVADIAPRFLSMNPPTSCGSSVIQRCQLQR